MRILFLVKRLALSLLLITITAAILLFSDMGNRKAKPGAGLQSFGKPQPGRIYKIGIVYFAPEDGVNNVFQGLFDGLKEFGFVKGENLEVVMKHASGEIPMIPQVLQMLDNSDVDLIVTMSTPCLTAACNTVKNKPVVLSYCYDPIAAGAGKSLVDHLPFVTGVSSFAPMEETVDFIKKLIPGIKSVGTMYNSSEANSRKVVSVGRELFRQSGIKLEEVTVTSTNEVMQAVQVIVAKTIQCLWITGDNTCIQAMDGIIKTAESNKMPLVVNDGEFVNKGALAAVGIGWYQTGKKTAEPVAKVLLGANPKDMPIINYVEKSIILNDRQAKKIGIKFPDEIIKLAENSGKKKIQFQKKLKFYLLEYVDSPNSDDCIRGILEGLTDAELVEDVDFDITVRNAQGDMATLNNMVDAAESSRSDLIFVLSTPTLQSAINKIKSTPIVCTNSADPVAAGAGRSFEDHLPNVTGISTMSDFDGMVKLLQTVSPPIKTIGTLFVPAEINSVIYKDKLAEAALKHNITLISLAVYASSDVSNAADVLCSKGIDALCQISDNLNNAAFASIWMAAQKTRKPVFTFLTAYPKKNQAVASVAKDYYVCGWDAGKMAMRILQGENPKNIPFTFARKTVTIINQKLALQFGIRFSEQALKSADMIIGEENGR